ncbi:hypothetical protein DFQ27_003837 [Actinomortierella ambigua]|uniref:Uncharacterized protein n=1 Tax=Actinomortierella ambigua TaxID=1343610 RepID=A0A9P6Q583_9FUNG|nr:hypothetical protein DFQ27_003837 [Actinomortierella ambigua]
MVESLRTMKASEDGNGDKDPVLLIAEAVITPKERTVEEYSALCKAEGLRIAQVWPTRGKHSILEVHLDPEAKDTSTEE